MGNENQLTAIGESNLQCVEILVSKKSISTDGHNLHWTLSVYSLQNQPVKKDWVKNDCEVFHFMVYDWNKTIKKLLEDHQVSFSVIQFFTPEHILADAQTDFMDIAPPILPESIDWLQSPGMDYSQDKHDNFVWEEAKN